VFHLAHKLRERGWLIPAYTLPANCESLAVLRFVIRAGFSRDKADVLLEDIGRAIDWFQRLKGPIPSLD
jgi:glutamate decarboxylase